MNENVKRAKLDQRRAPIHEALEKFRNMRVVPFDVPGHKRGRGNPELAAFLGQQCVFNGGRHHKLRTEHGSHRM